MPLFCSIDCCWDEALKEGREGKREEKRKGRGGCGEKGKKIDVRSLSVFSSSSSAKTMQTWEKKGGKKDEEGRGEPTNKYTSHFPTITSSSLQPSQTSCR